MTKKIDITTARAAAVLIETACFSPSKLKEAAEVALSVELLMEKVVTCFNAASEPLPIAIMVATDAIAAAKDLAEDEALDLLPKESNESRSIAALLLKLSEIKEAVNDAIMSEFEPVFTNADADDPDDRWPLPLMLF